MAIKLELKKTERILFCGSKWWGDPDMPENMQYPTMEVSEDGEKFDYPLTFVCQINCEDIAAFDKENKLPHEGMLYFFAAVDDYLGYESPVQNPEGEWPKGRLVVKYAKAINFACLSATRTNSLLSLSLKSFFLNVQMMNRASRCFVTETCSRNIRP